MTMLLPGQQQLQTVAELGYETPLEEYANIIQSNLNGFMILLPSLVSTGLILWAVTSTVLDLGIRFGRIFFPHLFKGEWDEKLQAEIDLINSELPDAKIDVKKLSQKGGIARAVLTEPSNLKRGLKVLDKAKGKL